MVQILRSSSLLVLPSRWEGMPNVLLEAMATGIPVVATRVSGVKEVLGDLAEQQSVELNDVEGFVSRIISIADDSELASNLGHANHQHVSQQHQIQDMILSYENLYQRMVAEKTNGGSEDESMQDV